MKFISEERLAELLRAEAYATALKYHNVDKWDYFTDSLSDPIFNNETYWEYTSQSDRDITRDFQSV
jgi:hypothetical protein